MADEDKEKKKNLLMLIGSVVLVVGIAADYVGLGGGAGFGPKQICVIVIGAVILFMGIKGCQMCKK